MYLLFYIGFNLIFFGMNKSNIVYSTENYNNNLNTTDSIKKINPNEQHLRLHLDRKGGGKILTVIKGLIESKERDYNSFKRIEKKKKMEWGGAVKNNEILIQGNKKERYYPKRINKKRL